MELHCIQGQLTPGSHLNSQALWTTSGFTQTLLDVSALSLQNQEHQEPLHTVTEVKAMNERLLMLLCVNSEHWLCWTQPGPCRPGYLSLVSVSYWPTFILAAASSKLFPLLFLLSFSKSKILCLSYYCHILFCLCVCCCHKCALQDLVLVSSANVNFQTASHAAISWLVD